MKILLLTAILTSYLAAAVASPHDAGYWAQLVCNLMVGGGVLWSLWKWGKRQTTDRAEQQRLHAAEMAAKQKLYGEIVAVYRQLAPEGKPSIIERVGHVEAEIETLKEETALQSQTLETQNRVLEEHTATLSRIEELVGNRGGGVMPRVQT